MEVGKLNKYVTIQHQTKVSDGMGGYTLTWTDQDSVWAAIWPVSAKEIIALNTTTHEITHRLRIRYRSNFRTAWRIKYGIRYFSIVSKINPEEKNEFLDLLCKEAA